MSYTINEDIVYLDKEGKLMILFIMSDEVITLNNVVAEIFLMMGNGLTDSQILHEVKKIYTGDEDPEVAVQNTIKQFLELKLFQKKA